MRFGVVRFPGSCDDVDALLAARRAGEAEIRKIAETLLANPVIEDVELHLPTD